jgi:hypothetical protein
MSRELRPVEIRVCRIVFALLGIIVLAFVVLSAIDFLFGPWPRARNVQSRPVVQSPPLIQSQIAQSQKSSRRGALADQPAGIALLRKEMQSQTPGLALDRAIRFDPGLLDRRVYGTSYIDADALPSVCYGNVAVRTTRNLYRSPCKCGTCSIVSVRRAPRPVLGFEPARSADRGSGRCSDVIPRGCTANPIPSA